MAKKYIIDPAYLAKHPRSITLILIEGQAPKRVAIGETEITVPAGIGGPERKISAPAPTQHELKVLYDAGTKYVLCIDEQPETVIDPTPEVKKWNKKKDSE
jgi:hypothetical protein